MMLAPKPDRKDPALKRPLSRLQVLIGNALGGQCPLARRGLLTDFRQGRVLAGGVRRFTITSILCPAQNSLRFASF